MYIRTLRNCFRTSLWHRCPAGEFTGGTPVPQDLKQPLTETHWRFARLAALVFAAGLTSACQPGADGRDVAQSAAPPEGPLARLDMLAGTWRGESTTSFIETDEEAKGRAATTLSWCLGGHYLCEVTTYETQGESASKVEGYWTWNAADEQYQFWRFDSRGRITVGTATYNPTEHAWTMSARTTDRQSGSVAHGHGDMRFVSDDEKTWTWTSAVRSEPGQTSRTTGRSRRAADQ